MFEKAGRYKILSKLGQGAMAEVFRAHDPDMGRDLAIKILNERYSADENFRTRFLRESRAAGVLSHPNIVTMYDVGEVDGRPFIAMELLSGASLDQHMKSGRRFSVQETVELGIQLADALDYAHSRGIVHRDIKPSNLILLGDDKTLKIADFGIARIEAPDVTSHTQTADVLGTPQYMSPEQVLGKKVDGRSDLFSVGIVLYQLLCGEKPFIAETLGTLLFRIASEPPRPLRDINPQLTPALYGIVDRLLAKEPDQRYENGAALAKALRAALNGGAAPAKAASSGEYLMWGAAVGVFLVVGGVGAWYWSSQETGSTSRAPPPAATAQPPQGGIAGAVSVAATPAAETSSQNAAAPAVAVEPALEATPPAKPETKAPTETTATPLERREVPVAQKLTTAPAVTPARKAEPARAPTETAPRATAQKASAGGPASPSPEVASPAPTPPSASLERGNVDAPASAATSTAKASASPPPAPRIEPAPVRAAQPPPDPAATMSITEAKQQLRDGKITKDEYRSLVDRIKQRYRDDMAALKAQLRSGAIDKRAYKEKAAELERGYE
jgi:tRNA A-37 threonylcarbamoyl transferase component Bud32